MITLSTLTFDLDGFVQLNEDRVKTTFPDLERRVTRTATLDGLSTINDSGLTYSDGTIVISMPELDKPTKNNIQYIISNYSLVRIGTRHGSFKGVIKSVTQGLGEILITIFIKEKTSG